MTKGIEPAQKSKGLGNFCKGALIGLGGLILSQIVSPEKALALVKPTAPTNKAKGEITEEILNSYYADLNEYLEESNNSGNQLYLDGDIRLAYFNSSESDSAGAKVRGTGFSPRADLMAKYQLRGRVSPLIHANTEMESCKGSILYDSANIADLNITNSNSVITAGCDIDIAKDGKLYGIISPRIGIGNENRSALINTSGFGGVDHQENYNSNIIELGYEKGIFSANLRYGAGQGSIIDSVGNLMNEAQKRKSESSLEVIVKNLSDGEGRKFSLRVEIGQKNYEDTKNDFYNAELLMPVGKNLTFAMGYGGLKSESNSYSTTTQGNLKLGVNYNFGGKYDLRKMFRGKQRR